MISYKLCKSLKESGFPQEGNDYSLYYFSDYIPAIYTKNELRTLKDVASRVGVDHNQNDVILCPTLSELIEACKGITIKLWILADGRSGIQLEGEGLDDVNYFDSPEEAVANLYLALHENI